MKSPIWFLASLLAASVATAAPKSPASAVELTSTEKWVVAQLTAGKVADLRSNEFPGEHADKDRKLSARFLEDLLTGTLSGVNLHRNGVRIIGAIIGEQIDLTNASIACDTGLYHCQFMSSVIFARATFAQNVSFSESTFNADADFNAMKVGHDAFFQNAVFEGPVDFISANIASNFEAPGAEFQNKEKGASFSGMKVGRVSLENATFKGPLRFVAADIASNFEAPGAKFQNKEKGASFSFMKVGQSAFFNHAVFEGLVRFVSAEIANNFEANGAKFQNKENGASFVGMKVRGVAFFSDAVFEGPVTFGYADIANNFEAQRAQFQNKEEGASFRGMKVRGVTFFNNAVFKGPLSFGYADFAWLDLSSAFWPKVPVELEMQGMSYKYIRAASESEPESHKALLRLADQSAYGADVYGSLEQFFLRQGYRGDADQAFITGKRRDRKENLSGLHWVGSWLLDWLVGYGRHPWQAGIPCALFVILGCFVFLPSKMEPLKPEDAQRVYNPFWYSLGLFLPFVNLQSAEVWKPKNDRWFLRHYMRVHILLGWILIPILLAAITGLIK